MRKAGLVACCLVAACGRIGFDAGIDGASVDASRDAVVDASIAPSCTDLASTCGTTGMSSCCDSPLVPGGTFFRSYDLGSDGMFADMTNPATVSDFRLDTYVATVGRFRQFVNAGMGTQANPPAAGAGARTLNGMAAQGGWDPTWNADLAADTPLLVAGVSCDSTFQTWTDAPASNEMMPMTCITWFEALAFCAWDGGFMPTEAEWNYAASGGTEQRAYPWSSPASSLTVDCSFGNYDPGTYCVNSPTGAVNQVGSESPKGDGLWGQADLGGNVWEWTLDWYESAYIDPCDDCADLTVDMYKTNRGGVFDDVASKLRTGFRDFATPDQRFYDFGVRCARAP